LTIDEKICIALQVEGGVISTDDAAQGFGLLSQNNPQVKRVFLNFIVALARFSMGQIIYPISQAKLQMIADDFQAKTYENTATFFHGRVCWWYWCIWCCCPYQSCKLERV
jgi:hypothetical protein